MRISLQAALLRFDAWLTELSHFPWRPTAHTLRERLPDALCLEMEGAAMAQVCHEFGVPFAVMRVISDSADHTAKTDFTDFLVNLARLYTAGILKPLLQSGALRDA